MADFEQAERFEGEWNGGTGTERGHRSGAKALERDRRSAYEKI